MRDQSLGLKMPITKTYIILNQHGHIDETFPSAISFAKHLGLSTARLTAKLKGKTTLTQDEYLELQQFVFKPIDYSMCGRNRKKGVKNG